MLHPCRNAYEQPIIARNDNSMRTEYVPEVLLNRNLLIFIAISTRFLNVQKKKKNRFESSEDPKVLWQQRGLQSNPSLWLNARPNTMQRAKRFSVPLLPQQQHQEMVGQEVPPIWTRHPLLQPPDLDLGDHPQTDHRTHRPQFCLLEMITSSPVVFNCHPSNRSSSKESQL